MLYIVGILTTIGMGTVVYGGCRAISSIKIVRERREEELRAKRWQKRFRELGMTR